MFRYYAKDPDGDLAEIVDHFERFVPDMGPELATNAAEGSVGSGTVKADDPRGLFNIRGHRLFIVKEDSALDDAFGGVVYFGYTFGRTVGRRAERQDAARTYGIDLVDLNTLLSDRVLHGTGNNREEESDLERVRWLLAQAEIGIVRNDLTFVDSTGGVPMDARDCNGDTPLDVLDDCAQQSGRNYFLLWQDSGGAVPAVYLSYRRIPSSWASSIRISNVIGEVDGTTFLASLDTELDRDPSRVYSDIYGMLDGGHVVDSRQATRDAYRNRWTHGQWERVKTKTQAHGRALRTLRDIETETDVITTAILVPRAMVNAAMAGQAIDVHYSDLPGYEDGFVTMEIRDRTVTEVSPELVQLGLSLTGPIASTSSEGFPACGDAFWPYEGVATGLSDKIGRSGGAPVAIEGWDCFETHVTYNYQIDASSADPDATAWSFGLSGFDGQASAAPNIFVVNPGVSSPSVHLTGTFVGPSGLPATVWFYASHGSPTHHNFAVSVTFRFWPDGTPE